MALFRFTKTPKHQRFSYKPRYWNPDKEDLERRVAAAEDNKGVSPEAMKYRIGTSMRRSYRMGKHQRSSFNWRYNLLLVGIIATLVFVSYYILTVYLPEIKEFLR